MPYFRVVSIGSTTTFCAKPLAIVRSAVVRVARFALIAKGLPKGLPL